MKHILLLAAVLATLAAAGCSGGGQGAATGYSKTDFAKTPPPAGFISNAPKAPPAPPAGSGAPK